MAVQLVAGDDAGRPRRAKPKVLDAPPAVFRAGAGGPPITADGDGTGDAPAGAPPSGVAYTADAAACRQLSEILGERRVDDRVAAEVARIGAALSLRARTTRGRDRGRARPSSMRYDGDGGDLDLDATLEVLAERRPFTSDELTVRRPNRQRRSIALLADVSGSMNGDKALICAAAIGALAGELSGDELTIIAFWSDVAVLRSRERGVDAQGVLDDLLRIEPRGLTNVHAAIDLARQELARSSVQRRSILLLSDCVHNAGPDPRLAARGAPTTHVMLERTGEHDAWLGERIARSGGGRFRTVAGVAEVAPALDALLAG